MGYLSVKDTAENPAYLNGEFKSYTFFSWSHQPNIIVHLRNFFIGLSVISRSLLMTRSCRFVIKTPVPPPYPCCSISYKKRDFFL
jgi:hypothetical protein